MTRLAALLAISSALAGAPLAAAAGPSSVSAIAQYVEMVPGATGATPVGGGAAGGTKSGAASRGATSLVSPAVEQKIASAGGSDRQLLKRVITSPAYGAPQHRLPSDPALAATSTPGTPSALGASIGAVSSNASLGLLLLALLASTGTVAVAAWRRSRTS